MKRGSKKPDERKIALPARANTALDSDFDEVLRLIDAARVRAVAAVNTTLIELYWQIGEHISGRIASAGWGKSSVIKLAAHIHRRDPTARGYSASNLWRMMQFFETYQASPKLATLLRELSWSHNLAILSRCKREEEREFYLRMAAKERWSIRELQRQLSGALFERVVLTPTKVAPLVRQLYPDAAGVFKDSYLLDFLNLPEAHSEDDLQRALVANLRRFLMELGADFAFVGERHRLQVGARDFFVDLLFYHRGLACLVAFELKVEQFEPADLGQLQFYLEALDRDVKKAHEEPSIGVLLCATKDNEVVEYALARTVSPALVAQYQTHLPDKKLLQAKLHEFYALADAQLEREAAALSQPPKAKKATGKRTKTK